MALGLGLMRLSSGDVSEDAALRVLHEALDRGVALFDTADVYAPSAGEIGQVGRRSSRVFMRWTSLFPPPILPSSKKLFLPGVLGHDGLRSV